MNALVILNETKNNKNHKRGQWEPSGEYSAFLEEALRNTDEVLRNGEPEYSDAWLFDNKDKILAAFSCGYSAKTISSIVGLTWTTWRMWVLDYKKFAALNEMGEGLQLMFMEQIRNEHARGELKGNATAALASIDRLHSDVYYGRPGMKDVSVAAKPDDLDLSEAIAILEEAGVDIDSL